MTYSFPFSITVLPMISLPAGLTKAGLPVGVQLAARRLREDSAIEAGRAYAAPAPGLFRRPTVDVARALPIPPVLPTPAWSCADEDAREAGAAPIFCAVA
jgi:hypothetical protein